MSTPKFDAVAASCPKEPSLRLRSVLDDMKAMSAKADALEPRIPAAVLEALKLLEREDEDLNALQMDVTVSVRNDKASSWKHFATMADAHYARRALEEFVITSLFVANSDEFIKGDQEPLMFEFQAHGAV